jgi:hypothetical protein
VRSRVRSRGRRWIIPAVGSIVLETAGTWQRSHRLGGDLVVRCRQGHLFTTIWIPAVSLKALRLGFWRFQYCPVGRHWTFVTPVVASELSEAERREAGAHRDIRIP